MHALHLAQNASLQKTPPATPKRDPNERRRRQERLRDATERLRAEAEAEREKLELLAAEKNEQVR